MSSPFGLGSLEVAVAHRSYATPGMGRGGLGLEGAHREMPDSEEAAVRAEDEKQPGSADYFDFTTDWAIAPPLVGSS